MSKIAFITGITGQDGSYLARLLLDKGYDVHGLVRWEAVDTLARIEDIKGNLTLHDGDVTDANCINHIVRDIQPSEIYHLAALSHVAVSFKNPAATVQANVQGALNVFEAARLFKFDCKIYNAASSEMFGSSPPPQNEETKMLPCSPYGVAKLAAYHMARVYRESYGMFIANGILFNHESPMRGGDFVTQKIVRAAVRGEPLALGNLDARRDWGHAKDYVRGMWMMLQHSEADDFVLASGETYSVREFAERVFARLGSPLKWENSETKEIGLCKINSRVLVTIDPQFFRPVEVDVLQGDATKAREVLGWSPEHSLDDLIDDMIAHEKSRL